MEIRQERLLNFVGAEGVRFAIPVFQRVYSWNARQCEELWDDIMAAGAQSNQKSDPHFMGMLLYAADPDSWQGLLQLNIIDGQQRLTTVSLLLCALARYLDEIDGQVDGLKAADLLERYLRVEGENGQAAKLTLSFMDRETLYALVGMGEMPDAPAGRIIGNAELFYNHMKEPGFDLQQLWQGLNRLEYAGLLLGNDDSPQIVFESLNSKGMALSTADRMRNYIVVTDEAAEEKDGGLFESVWLPLEALVAGSGIEGFDVTQVVHAWLAKVYRGVRIVDKSELYGLFKSRLRAEYDDDIARALNDVSAYASNLIADEALREEDLSDARAWVAGKPKDLISEYKMFGD